ncbi:hypothetical protein GOP47_0010896 [Adiantum capillus-veneris]|nr:hypothetical protein GOP47_0010896 [Adiantum capillus-veneris]
MATATSPHILLSARACAGEAKTALNARVPAPLHSTPCLEILQVSKKDINHEQSSFARRRLIFIGLGSVCGISGHDGNSSALALGDPTVTLKDVTPTVATRGELPPNEERLVTLFEKTTYSVVNVFDVTLRPRATLTGMVE